MWNFFEEDPVKGTVGFDMYRVTSVGFSTESTEPGAYELMEFIVFPIFISD